MTSVNLDESKLTFDELATKIESEVQRLAAEKKKKD